MRVRYRKFTCEFDSRAYADRIRTEAGEARQSAVDAANAPLAQALSTDVVPHNHALEAEAAGAAGAAIAGLVSNPDIVHAEEKQAELEDVKTLDSEVRAVLEELAHE